MREQGLLRELDGVVVEARLELKEKRESIHELKAAKESTERELTKNKLKVVLEKNLRNLEDQIREELSKSLSVTWVKVEWKKEQLEQSLGDVCKVVKMEERPFRTEDYSLKLRTVWYHEGTGSSVIENPRQLAIDTVERFLCYNRFDRFLVGDLNLYELLFFCCNENELITET